MAKSTIGTKLPRKLEQKMQEDDILLLAKEDTMGKALQDLNLKQRERASKKG